MVILRILVFLMVCVVIYMWVNYHRHEKLLNDYEKNHNQVKFYVARDKDNDLYIFIDELPPKKKREKWTGRTFSTIIEIPKRHFTQVQWSDEEPTKVKLEIVKQ